MLSLNNLDVYYGASQILFDVSMEIKTAQVVCLLGRNGVGKTTLLKTIMGTLKPRSGEIHFNGQDVTKAAPHVRAQAGIGYVPQGRGIFPHLTVFENLLMGFESVARKQIDNDAIAEMYSLFPIIHTMRNRVAGTLSGGQQQQLAIARALIRKPKLLLLDEPTEGIQPSIVEQIEEVIMSIRESRAMSILLIEQFLDFALGVADHCFVLEKGSIVSSSAAAGVDQSIVREYLSV
jgi:urea transport system ATP-binding protein